MKSEFARRDCAGFSISRRPNRVRISQRHLAPAANAVFAARHVDYRRGDDRRIRRLDNLGAKALTLKNHEHGDLLSDSGGGPDLRGRRICRQENPPPAKAEANIPPGAARFRHGHADLDVSRALEQETRRGPTFAG